MGEEKERAILQEMQETRKEMVEAVTAMADSKKLFEAAVEELKRHQTNINDTALRIRNYAEHIKGLQEALNKLQVARAQEPRQPREPILSRHDNTPAPDPASVTVGDDGKGVVDGGGDFGGAV